MEEFSPKTILEIDYYVYALIDPRKRKSDPRKIFYVGKGKGQRCFQHARAAVKVQRDEPNPKLALIREINLQTSEPPPIQIIGHKLSEEKALWLEAILIKLLQTDRSPTGRNRTGGKHARNFCLMADDIEGLYAEPIFSTKLGQKRVLLVSLNGGEDLPPYDEIKKTDMAGRILGKWDIAAKNAKQVEYVIGVYGKLTKRVYEVSRRADSAAVFYRRKCENKKGKPMWRVTFVGKHCPSKEKKWCPREIKDSKGKSLTTFGRRPTRMLF